MACHVGAGIVHRAVRNHLASTARTATCGGFGSAFTLGLARFPFLGQGIQRERAFSTDNSYVGQQVRIERLWREFFLGPSHWRAAREGPNETIWIEDAGAKAAAVTKDEMQSMAAKYAPPPPPPQNSWNYGFGLSQLRVGQY